MSAGLKDHVELYLNAKQQEFGEATQKIRVWIGGRGCGKSTEIGFVVAAKVEAMPRSRGFLAAATFKQIETKTWPGIAESLSLMGMEEGVHYVYGVKPPPHFDKPYARLKRYGDIVSFRNGSIIEFLSLDRPDNARGGSYDHGDIDEAALLKHSDWTKILLPAVRGNRFRFGRCHWHHMVGMYTSMPWKSSGLWILDYEQKAKDEPDKYFFLTATAYDNLDVLGEEGIQRMRDEMTYLEFQMEVMNEYMIQTEEAFYDRFNEATHVYQPKYKYAASADGPDRTTGSDDVNPDAMLEAAWDFGGWFNCCAVFQEKPNRTEHMVAAFNSKLKSEDVKVVVSRFCDHFSEHRFKYVRLWGEPRGHDPQAGMTDTMYELLVKEFAKRGWRAEIMAPRKASRKQIQRQAYMATILAEDTAGYPRHRMNGDTCKWAVLAIQSTQKLPDGSKDKRMEKDRNANQESAPHITDAIDYYYDQKWGPRVSTNSGSTRGLAGGAMFG